MNNPSHIFAIVEDQRQMQFLYRFLRCEGMKPHEITIDFSPSAQGSAEQWVRENFAKQVGKCRARNACRRAATSMFVVLDADNQSVKAHHDELDNALEADHQQKLDPVSDPIARLIPKWSVETWILVLSCGGVVQPPLTESKSHKHSRSNEQWSELIPQASKTLSTWTHITASRPGNLLNSLQRGLEEIPRALPAAR
jgi:hypothetical protein